MALEPIYGQNVVLRPFRPADRDAIWMGGSDPELRYLTGTQATFTLEQLDRYIQHNLTADDRAAYVIADPQTLDPLGEVIIMDIDPDNRSGHIRIAMFSVEQTGRGLGREAMRLMVDYAFETLKLHRLELQVFTHNPRAKHVYEQVGFQQEGLMRDTLLWDGVYSGTIIMAILEDDWRARQTNRN